MSTQLSCKNIFLEKRYSTIIIICLRHRYVEQ